MNEERLYREDGAPRFIQCYETKRNPVVDRYTVVFTRANIWGGPSWRGRVCYVGMSEYPSSPVGFYQHGEAGRGEFCPRGSWIDFTDLPVDGQMIVKQEYAELWTL